MGFNFVRDVIEKNDRRKTALIVSDADLNARSETYGTFLKRSYRLANYLYDMKVRPGNRIMIMMENSLEIYHAVTASIAMGAVYAPMASILPDSQIKYRIDHLSPKIIFTDNASYDKLKGFGDNVVNLEDPSTNRTIEGYPDTFTRFYDDPDAEHVIFFTSGTEGNPKMVLHNNTYPMGHRTTVKWLDLRAQDIHWNISSPGWAKWGWSSYYSPMISGSTVFNMRYRRFDPEMALNAMEKFLITSICAPPTVWRMFLLQDLSSRNLHLRKAASAGEPLNPEIIDRIRQYLGVTVKDGYGQSESTLMVGNIENQPVKPGSMGKPLEPYRVVIVDDSGNRLPANSVGHIAVDISQRPNGLFNSYMNDQELTRDRFRNGLYYTGDMGYMDEDGYLWFVSRSDDVIKSSDYRIGPFEVESALLRHPAVAESAVVGTPDDIRGNLVKAFVVLKSGYSASQDLARELSIHVRNLVGPHARPKKIEFVNELPKTISGKIIRKELRKLEMEKYSRGKNGSGGGQPGFEFYVD
ncbi:AMP-binding protein [Thermoplasma sp.]|uniref:AMP-binding protein n=1 Tax=Thermoplasma sp. TaxID=1973142 RepID=UPI001289F211|nr:AMP-binding protein [Thermoplasma sp.]KAA8922041.1 MAG: acyl--CoA ligase [Thermoplasma sp.]